MTLDDESPLQRRRKPVCEKCGGFGWFYPPGEKSAMRCDACGGDKISRNPKHYADRRDIPPLPRR